MVTLNYFLVYGSQLTFLRIESQGGQLFQNRQQETTAKKKVRQMTQKMMQGTIISSVQSSRSFLSPLTTMDSTLYTLASPRYPAQMKSPKVLISSLIVVFISVSLNCAGQLSNVSSVQQHAIPNSSTTRKPLLQLIIFYQIHSIIIQIILNPLNHLQIMSKQKTVNQFKIIANTYKLLQPLFEIGQYIYAQICSVKNNYQILHAALVNLQLIQYLYQNEEPSQALKMLAQKLQINEKNQIENLIFPINHIKDKVGDKQLSLFILKDYILPFNVYQKGSYFTTQQMLEIIHGALTCLNVLHIHEIVHENISLKTCYITKPMSKKGNCKFALNILDTSYFLEENSNESIQDIFYHSEAKSQGQKISYKDDLESLVYVLVHMLSKGKMLSKKRYQTEWVTESEFLRWKTCEFFRQMVQIVPPDLNIIIQMFTLSKNLSKNEKPDYVKLIKRVMSIMSIMSQRRKGQKVRQSINQNKINQKELSQLMQTFHQSKFKNSSSTSQQQNSLNSEEYSFVIVNTQTKKQDTLQYKLGNKFKRQSDNLLYASKSHFKDNIKETPRNSQDLRTQLGHKREASDIGLLSPNKSKVMFAEQLK